MKYCRIISLSLALFAVLMGMQACSKAGVRTGQGVPEIVWPPSPEVPRIRFVRSVSGPEDLNIGQGVLKLFFRFLRGPAESTISMPYGIETDNTGRFFVVDTANKSVHAFDPGNDEYYTFPQKGISLSSPIDIAIDSGGNIYVSDSKEAVIKVFRENGREFVRDIGKGVLGRPTGIAVNEKTGELLVVDSLHSEVMRFSLDTHELKGKAGRGGSNAGMFHFPTNIFVSKDGKVFISDSLNFRVQVFTPDLKFLGAFGRPGDSPGYFARPKGVAVDSDGNIYVVDALFDNVQVFNKHGKLLMDFGKPGNGYGEFWLPSGIFIDSNDKIYVSDSYNKRVQVFQYLKKGGTDIK